MLKTDQHRPVSEERLQRLTAWAKAKPRIVLMGEFSSGKSTLLNLLIGEELLPTKVTATELPPVWFSHGDPCAWWVSKDGQRHDLDFGSFDGVPRSARYIRVFTPSPMLQRCDIIDTPGISDPNLEEESWRFAVGQASFILWCTSATQAWRETERSTWTSLPERLRANSVMVVTRSDKLGPDDREKVRRRLGRESFGLFGGLVFLSTPEAVRGLAALTEAGDATLWEASGGSELDARIESGLESVRAARLDLLDRYESTGPALPSATRPDHAPVTHSAPILVLPTAAPAPEGFDAVRPRRVEVPSHRRTERPAAEEVDPLATMRAAWTQARGPEDGHPDHSEPAHVLRLPDPVRPLRAEIWSEEDGDAPLLLDRAWAASPMPSEETAPEEPVAEETAWSPEPAWAPEPPVLLDSEETASLDAVLSAVAELEPAPPTEEPSAEALPRAVRVWRDIVARNPEIPSNSPILAMIDQLLCELSRDDGLSDGIADLASTNVGQTRAA